jgi:hypothetical protein
MEDVRAGWWWAAAVGVGVPAAAFLALASLPAPTTRPGTALTALCLAGVAWAWASSRAGRVPIPWGTVLGGAVLLRGLAWAAAPDYSDDALRYVWEALVLLDGRSPYAFAPAAPELAALRERWPELFAGLNHPQTSAAYPPLYQAASVGVVSLARAFGETGLVERALWFQRLFAAGCDLCVLFALRALLAALRLPAARAVVWAWSPLAALEFAGVGHMDALGIALWTAALAVCATGARPVRAVLLLTAAALVKFLPALSVPCALRGARGERARALAAAVLVVGAACLPLFALEGGARGLGRGLADYGTRWESTSILYRFVEPPLAALAESLAVPVDARVLGRGLCALVWLALAWRAWRDGSNVVRATWTWLGAFLVLSPTLHPWYLAWALPFLACFPSRAWTWLVAFAPLCYTLVARWRIEGLWHEPAWLWPLWALPFLALGLRERLSRP